jgi:hypothetical protein
MIIGRFFVDARIRSRTIYALTNRRAIIISGLFSRTVNSLLLRTLTDISLQERTDQSGTILLARPQPNSQWNSGMRLPGMSQYSTPSFEMIPNAKAVHDQLLKAQRAAA